MTKHEYQCVKIEYKDTQYSLSNHEHLDGEEIGDLTLAYDLKIESNLTHRYRHLGQLSINDIDCILKLCKQLKKRLSKTHQSD